MKRFGYIAAALLFAPACSGGLLSVGNEMEGGSTGDGGSQPGRDAQPPTQPMTDAQPPPILDDAQGPGMPVTGQGPCTQGTDCDGSTDAQPPPILDAQGPGMPCTQDTDCGSSEFCGYTLPPYPTPTGCAAQGVCHDQFGPGPVGGGCQVVVAACGCNGMTMAIPACGEAYVLTPFAYYGNCE